MSTASKSREVSRILARPALWFCACNLLAAALVAQCSNPTQVPNGTYTSGDHSATDNNALSASTFVISGSATATLAAGNCIQLLPGFHATAGTAGTTFHAWVETAPAAVSVSPSSSSGLTQPFTWTVSSPSGYSNLSDVFALFNTSISGANACYIHYNRPSNLLYVADSSGSNWSTGVVPGSSGTTGAFSPNCTVNGTGSSVNPSGAQLALTASVTFQTTFSGTKNRYLIAYDNEGLNTTWQQFGTWTVGSSGGFTPIRISSGGAYTDTLGQVWSADYGYLQGSTYSTASTITGTPDQRLYQTERWNQPSLTYQFSVPNGNYTATLKFAEIFGTAPGQRYMNATLNGTTVFTNLDVWTAAGGPNRAYDLSYPVSVTNGQLTITLTCTSSNNSAEVNAIQIVTGTTQQYYLTTAVPSGGGSTNPSCPGGCSYSSGSPVTITATPATGYQFSGFTGSVSSGSNPLTVTINSAMTETVNFTQTATQYQLTTSVSPSGGGTISPSCPGGCTYSSGSAVTVTATPGAGYIFSGFSGSISSSSNPLTVTLNGPISETANFAVPMGTSSYLHANVGWIPFNDYDTGHSASSSGFSANGISSCPSGASVQSCFQTILGQLRTQGATGVRFFIPLCDAFPDCGPSSSWNPGTGTGQSPAQQTFITNVGSFFQDVATAGIGNVTITLTSSGPTQEPDASSTSSPTGSCSVAINCSRDIESKVKFDPLIPYGMAPSDGLTLGDYWKTTTNQGYNQAPINNVNFLGWTNYFNAINAVLAAAHGRVNVYGFEIAQELDVTVFTAMARYFYDNSSPQTAPPSTLRRSAAPHISTSFPPSGL